MRALDYTTVIAQGSPGYMAPLEPSCKVEQRFMAVHRVSGGGWGIVDRRSGRLVAGPHAAQDRYASWTEVNTAVGELNAHIAH